MVTTGSGVAFNVQEIADIGAVQTPYGSITVMALLQVVFVVTLCIVGAGGLFSYVAAARTLCRRERRRVADELEAFRSFRSYLDASTPTESPATSASPQRTMLQQSNDGLAAVRDAFAETVMAVDHYEDDYDETLIEHARAELGPDAGGALVEADAFTPGLRSVLIERTDAAIRQREQFLEQVDIEVESLRESERRLVAPVAESGTLVEPLDDTYPALEARWQRFGTIEQHVEQVVADRTRHTIDETTVVPSYLYESFPVPDPVVADASAALGVIRERRAQVTSALTRAT
ncbi:MAG: hypothetical protein U5K28_05980 [Halobacteriales archaeon]|nr:hypothetical protein [Halobacteriales archaeon]